jgi:ribosomal protein L12E/L44/L45/RPP1/RPP2
VFLRHQLKRPYISWRPSALYGDPLNDAEIMTTRVLIWGAIMFTVKEVFETKIGGGMEGLVDAMAVFLLAALLYSQWPLFQGVTEDLRDAVGDKIGLDVSARSRENSAHRDIGFSSKIEQMLACKSAVEMWKLQKALQGPMLLKSERARWEIDEETLNSKKTKAHVMKSCCKLLGAILGALVSLPISIVIIWKSSQSDALVYTMLALVVLSGVGMEAYRVKYMVTGKKRESIRSWVGRNGVSWTSDKKKKNKGKSASASDDGDNEEEEEEEEEEDGDADGVEMTRNPMGKGGKRRSTQENAAAAVAL